MATKTLTIMEDAYEILKSVKKENESFSDVIRRELGTKKNLKKFCGSIDNETANIIKNTIKKSRAMSKRMNNYDMS